jgi:hypothetical protein
MKNIFFITSIFLVSLFANAESLSTSQTMATCDPIARTCFTSISFVKNTPVTWLITAQATSTQGLTIEYQDAMGNWILMVDTRVRSIDLNNKSTGDFIAPITGPYKVTFTNTTGVRDDTAVIINDLLQPVAVTRQYASEDVRGGVYIDSFVTITALFKKG